mgnify:CR=1 FL=1
MSFLKKLFGGGEEKSDPLQKLGINLNEMVQKAQDASAVHVEIQTATASDYMTMASAITGANREPRTTFVKKTTCHNCGGAKTLAPKTAYVYCDFCGSLTDYDFQKACENPQSAMPGPAYEQLVRSLQADIEAAKKTDDAVKFKEIQRQLYGKWVELCPNANSPRAKNDEEYRNQLVEYMAEMATINEFDPTYRQFADQVNRQTRAIQWSGTFPRPVASGETFWPLFETVSKQLDFSFDLMRDRGVIERHPDQAPESLQRRMAASMFCQGWLPCLGEEDSERMIRESGLKGEYSKLEPKETTLRHCGSCGGDLQVLSGAKAVLCEDCGIRIDVSADEVNCANCGGLISFPMGKNRTTCPFCKAEAQRMSW